MSLESNGSIGSVDSINTYGVKLSDINCRALEEGAQVWVAEKESFYTLEFGKNADVDHDFCETARGSNGGQWIKTVANSDGKIKAGLSDNSYDFLENKITGVGGVTVTAEGPVPPKNGLELWFKADELTGEDDSVLPNWIDASGNVNIAAQTNESHRPILKTNELNGMNVVRCSNSDGNNQVSFLTGSFDIHNGTGLSVFYIAKTGSSLSQYGSVFGALSGPIGWNFAIGSSLTEGAGWSGSVSFGAVEDIATSTPVYGQYIYDKENWTLGGVNTTTHADTLYPEGVLTYQIGTSTYPASQLNADIAEILVYSRPLSEDEAADVESYLKFKWGLDESEQDILLKVGYPDVINYTNNFAIRYVHPAGNDNNDGRRWETAKQTILAAYDSLAETLPLAAQAGEIYIHEGSYVGGEVESQGIWLWGDRTDDDPGDGWRPHRPVKFIGVGGSALGAFGQNKAIIYRGNPGDSQEFDLTKPLFWCYDMQSDLTFENLAPSNYGFARFGVKYDGLDRSGLTSNLTVNNCAMVSPPDTADSYGPAWDCGWLNICWFNYCAAAGANTLHTIPIVAAADNVVASSNTWTFANGAFVDGDVDGWITVTNAANSANNGRKTIVSVINSTTITTSGTTVNETFDDTVTMTRPIDLQSDDKAGWLFKPNPGGTMGYVTFNHVYPNAAGIKYYVGAQGIGLSVSEMITENGPQPHPIHLDVIEGDDAGTSQLSKLFFKHIEVADGDVQDSHMIWINPLMWSHIEAFNCLIAEQLYGSIYGPALKLSSDVTSTAIASTPFRYGQFGISLDGRLSARTDGGRRLGAPVAAPFVNIISHDPTAWTAISGATKTAVNTRDVFGGNNSCDTDSSVSGRIRFYFGSRPFTDGDLIVAGFWVRSATLDVMGGNRGAISVLSGGFNNGLNSIAMRSLWNGHGEWLWCGCAGEYTGSGSDTLIFDAIVTAESRICFPILLHIPADDTGGSSGSYWSDTEAWELLANAATWNPDLAVGSVGTLRGQPLVGSGGLGINASIAKTAGEGSGQLTVGSVLKYEPRYDKDGTTIIGWVPIYSATVNP